MKSRDPLRIFTPEQINNITESNIKNLKREFLLEYQLTNETVVTFNKHQLDKNAVLLIFEELQTNFEFRIKEYYDNLLTRFLENGDFNYLKAHDKYLLQHIKDNTAQRDKLLLKTSLIISELITVSTEDRKDKLAMCRNITSSLPKEYENRAYSEAVRYLRIELESMKNRYDNPFRDNVTLYLEPEIRAMVDVRFIELFLLLPDQFHFLAYEYAMWCQDFIIKLSKFREDKWQKYPIDSLLVLRDASLIASQFYDEKKHLHTANEISLLLRDPQKLAKMWKRKMKNKVGNQFSMTDIVGLVISVVFLAILILYFIARS